jgi:diguanylate cyclase (GGDEF)-like protein/PAS domain S-box-containing protein
VNRRTESNNSNFSPWVGMPATITACVAALTLLVAFLLYEQAATSARQQQSANAAKARAALHGLLESTIGRVQELAVSASEHWPSNGQFAALADGLLQNQALYRVALVRYLSAHERAAYERRHGPITLPASSAATRLAPPTSSAPAAPLAPPASSYFVLASAVGPSAWAMPLGTDVGTEQRRHIALLAAAASGTPQASAPVAPAGALGSQPAVTAIYAPIYRSGAATGTPLQRLAALRGFVSCGYHYSVLAPMLASKLPPDAAFTLRDGGVRIVAHGRPAQAQVTSIPVAGRYWTLAVGAPALDLTLPRDALLVGGTLTLLFGFLSIQAYRRERFALSLVQRRATEREIAESALARAEERFRTAFSEAPIGMALIAPDGRHLQVNRALRKITGYTEQQLLTLPAIQLTHPDDRRAEEMATAFMLSGQLRVYDVEKRLCNADGEVAWVAAHTTLIRDKEKRPAYFLTQVEDITARHDYESRLQHMAQHDPLTGLLNRRAYEHALGEHLAGGPAGEGRQGAVLVLDLDDFKHVNDTLGHGAGDDLIVRVANALRERLRSDDVIARLGGDEFAILLRSGDPSQVRHVADSLLGTVRAQRAARGQGGRERPVTASIGIVSLSGPRTLTAEEALTAADLAMYDAKEAGRDRHETYGGQEQQRGQNGGAKARIETRLEWVERIRAALDEDRLVLHAQPVVETASGAMTQHELLIRMLDLDGALIEPGRFLPIAERYGLIREIDRWVIGKAIAMLGQERAGGRTPVVEINLSGQSLGDPDLAEHVRQALAAAEVDPRQLIFEVTETAAIGNIAAARGCAQRLGALGCRFALDDFGAGFGSFYYLKHLPFDFIKIDGEFVRSCTVDPTDRLVVRAVVELARGMSKLTIAEFVGDAQTLAVLRELGVDYVQGFHLGKPSPLGDWLAYGEGRRGRPDQEDGSGDCDPQPASSFASAAGERLL